VHQNKVNLWQNILRMIIIIVMSNAIIAVAGPPGSGKTTWICQNFMLQAPESVLYGLPPTFAWRLSRGLEFAERADDPTHISER
jgi:hypothetical protein